MAPTITLREARPSTGWDRMRLGLAAIAAASLIFAGPAAALRALDCAGVAISGGCFFTNTGGDTPDPNDGYAVTNADGVPMWDSVRKRDVQAIGYPISQRWTDGPFTLQAFQKVILQWDPGHRRMNYYNTLDVLANSYPSIELPNVPAHQVLAADAGADFETVKANHLALLDANPAIKARFLGEPDWLNLYGLPIRYEAREVQGNPHGLQTLRAQRAVFALWNVPAPGTTQGQVVLQNLPDKVKQLADVIVPDDAEAPITPQQADVFASQQAYRRSDDDDAQNDDVQSSSGAGNNPPGTDNDGTDSDGFDTTNNTDNDGYDTTANTDHDGFDTTGNTDRDGFDTTGNTDRDGFDTTANTDHDGFDTTGNTDRDGFDTTANTDHDGFDTTGNDTDDTDDTD